MNTIARLRQNVRIRCNTSKRRARCHTWQRRRKQHSHQSTTNAIYWGGGRTWRRSVWPTRRCHSRVQHRHDTTGFQCSRAMSTVAVVLENTKCVPASLTAAHTSDNSREQPRMTLLFSCSMSEAAIAAISAMRCAFHS